MVRVLINREMREKLLGLTQPLELVDDNGRVVAQVLPAGVQSRLHTGEPDISAEELKRIEAEEDFSLDEVFAHLKKLENA